MMIETRIEEIVKEVTSHLENVIIPFWKRLKDEKAGGYYGWMDYELNVDHEAWKGCILNSRILWFFSNAYMVLGEENLIEYASHAFDFFKQAFWDKTYGGAYWSVTSDGRPLDETKHTYNLAFAVYGLSSYYEASKDQEALILAMEIYHTMEEKCKDDFGYKEAFDRCFKEIDNEKLSENGILAKKTMNTLLHVFEAYTELYRVSGTKEVKDSIWWILDIFAGKVYNPGKHRHEVFFDEEMNTLADLHSLGHDIEAAWLIDRGVEIIDEESYKKKMHPITRDLTAEVYRHLEEAGGLADGGEKEDLAKSYVWWVQAETVVGFLNGWKMNDHRTEYLDAVQQTWDFIKEQIWDKRKGGEWYAEIGEDGQPARKPEVEPWKCPYHNGRMCLEVIKRGRKISE